MTESEAFKQALALLSKTPFKQGTAKQLKQLEKQVREDEQSKFGDLWEAFMAGASIEDIMELDDLDN